MPLGPPRSGPLGEVKVVSEPRYFSPWRAYDVMAVLVLLPLVAMLSWSLPDDIANHQRRTLPGMATVIKVEPFRTGQIATYEVRSLDGSVVGTTEDVQGIDVDAVGQSAPVNYVPMDPSDAYAAAYAEGEDPLWVNSAILAVVGAGWMVAWAFVIGRLVRFVAGLRERRRLSRPYRPNIT